MCQALNLYMQSVRRGEEISSLQQESTGRATLQRLLWLSTSGVEKQSEL